MDRPVCMCALKACEFPAARRATGRKSLFMELFVAQGSYDSLVEAGRRVHGWYPP
jgi:hypothetical protein